MILFQQVFGIGFRKEFILVAGAALMMAACAPMEEESDALGSRLAQPPAGTPQAQPNEAGDIAIVGQEVAHSIMDLSVIAEAKVPPLVQFLGVTSIIDKPINTDPYTQLLRDRLLLLTREKLRFVERTLPPLVIAPKKGKHKQEKPQSPEQNLTNPNYQILAELRGHADDEFYKIQVQFVDIRTNQVLFDGLYRIRPEAVGQPAPSPDNSAAPASNTIPDNVPPTSAANPTGVN